MARKAKVKIDIDVLPYLSIMVCTLNIICLILIITVMRIAMNPQQVAVISLKGLFSPTPTMGTFRKQEPAKDGVKDTQTGPTTMPSKKKVIRVPTYVECLPDKISIFPGEGQVRVDDLRKPANPLDVMLKRMETNTANEYVIMLVRPYAVNTYRAVRQLVKARGVDFGYDILDEGAVIDWKAEAKALNIQLAQ